MNICSNTFDFDKEQLFYKSIIDGNDWKLLKRYNSESSYKYIDSSKIIVFISTAIGYEAISRGSLAAAFTIRSEATNIRSHKFGWPYQFDKNYGEFWINYFDDIKMENILEKLLQEKKENFKNLIKNKYNFLLPFDPENTILKKKLIQLKIN